MKKNFVKVMFASAMMMGMTLSFGMRADAAEATIKKGIYAEEFDLSGKTVSEAESVIKAYVEELGQTRITLVAAEGNEIVTTADELGLHWTNPEIVQEAAGIGLHGNVIDRYKLLKDLEHDGKVYDIELAFDMQNINDIISTEGVKYNVDAVDAGLSRKNGEFVVIPGENGYALDVEKSIDIVADKLEVWNRKPCEIRLEVNTVEPRGKAEDLTQVRDLLGSYTTYFIGSGFGRAANIINGCNMINGTVLYPGDEFSANAAMAPFTAENGYYDAGTYVNGQVVDSIGGGVCQISSTLYNAVLRAELEVSMRYNHSMTVGYVPISADAALAEEAGKDFKFINNTDYPIYIESYITNNEEVTFRLYGKETRPAGHSVSYESEVIETIPSESIITTDVTLPLGIYNYQSGHTGYKARLWKITMENGVQVSKEQVNTSNYRMTSKSATVGVVTPDPEAYNMILQALATNDLDNVRAVLNAVAEKEAAAAAAAAQPQEQEEEE